MGQTRLARLDPVLIGTVAITDQNALLILDQGRHSADARVECRLALVCDLRAITAWTPHTVWPTQVPNGLKTISVVDDRLNVYHGAQYRLWYQLKQVLETRWPPQ
jgi:hypothetical protein